MNVLAKWIDRAAQHRSLYTRNRRRSETSGHGRRSSALAHGRSYWGIGDEFEARHRCPGSIPDNIDRVRAGDQLAVIGLSGQDSFSRIRSEF